MIIALETDEVNKIYLKIHSLNSFLNCFPCNCILTYKEKNQSWHELHYAYSPLYALFIGLSETNPNCLSETRTQCPSPSLPWQLHFFISLPTQQPLPTSNHTKLTDWQLLWNARTLCGTLPLHGRAFARKTLPFLVCLANTYLTYRIGFKYCLFQRVFPNPSSW